MSNEQISNRDTTTRGVENAGEPVTTAEPMIDAESKSSSSSEGEDWTGSRAAITGAIAAFLFGIIFFAGYSGTSIWICSSQLTCGHWAPIAITAGTGVMIFGVLGALAGFVLNKVYRLFKVV